MQDSIFGPNIPPEFVRLRGAFIKDVEPSKISANGVQIHFRVIDILGYGSSFSEPLLPNDTIVAQLKFGHNSIERSSVDSLKNGAVFIAEMEGNPIIENKYTIDKLLLTQ